MSVSAAPGPGLLAPAPGAASWRALGTYVELRTADPALVAEARGVAEHVLERVDESCSRFRADSDLVRANAAMGPTPVSPVLVGAVRVALEAAEVTDGLVDPTLGRALVAAGYGSTFALVPPEDPTPVSLPRRHADWREVVVTDSTVEVPGSLALDLGATGKAYAADLVALSVCRLLPTAVVVSLGGDLRVATPEVLEPAASGRRESGRRETGWPVDVACDVAALAAGRRTARVWLDSGGLATSSTTARRWVRGGRAWHHVLDPRTGEPVSGPWVSVTALGATSVAANTASTAALVLGARALDWLEDRDVAALLTGRDGDVVRTRAWRRRAIEVAPETEDVL